MIENIKQSIIDYINQSTPRQLIHDALPYLLAVFAAVLIFAWYRGGSKSKT